MGLAVGLTIFFFILFCVVVPIAICVLIYCCVAGALGTAFRSRPVTTVTSHAPQPAATVVTTTAAVCNMYCSDVIRNSQMYSRSTSAVPNTFKFPKWDDFGNLGISRPKAHMSSHTKNVTQAITAEKGKATTTQQKGKATQHSKIHVC